MRAPYAEQRKLLDLQPLDIKLTQLRHQYQHLPAEGELAQAEHRQKKLQRLYVQAMTKIADIKRQLTVIETDATRVEQRCRRQKDRLDSNKVSARELIALESEVKRLQERHSDLEEQQLAIMHRIEAAEETVEKISTAQKETKSRIEDLCKQRDSERSKLQASLDEIGEKRTQLARTIQPDLLHTYEHICQQTGGRGVVGLTSAYNPHGGIQLSPAEWDSIVKSDKDEVSFSQDDGYIIVVLPTDCSNVEGDSPLLS